MSYTVRIYYAAGREQSISFAKMEWARAAMETVILASNVNKVTLENWDGKVLESRRLT